MLKTLDCGYSLEPPHWGSSNEYPQSMFEQKSEKYQFFLFENFQVKFSIYLNRRVFVMKKKDKQKKKKKKKDKTTNNKTKKKKIVGTHQKCTTDVLLLSTITYIFVDN